MQFSNNWWTINHIQDTTWCFFQSKGILLPRIRKSFPIENSLSLYCLQSVFSYFQVPSSIIVLVFFKHSKTIMGQISFFFLFLGHQLSGPALHVNQPEDVLLKKIKNLLKRSTVWDKAFVNSYEKEIKSTVNIKQIIQIIIYTYINFLYINY